MPTPASGVCMGRGAELESRGHEGGSKVGFMARFHSIMLRLLPGSPSSLSSVGFCSEGPGNEADGYNTSQCLLVEGWMHVAHLSCGASWSKATSGVCCVAQGLCPNSSSQVQETPVPWGLKLCPLTKPSRSQLPADALCQVQSAQTGRFSGGPGYGAPSGLGRSWLLSAEDWSQLPFQPFRFG